MAAVAHIVQLPKLRNGTQSASDIHATGRCTSRRRCSFGNSSRDSTILVGRKTPTPAGEARTAESELKSYNYQEY
jgi:hypothetical protein